MPYAAKRKLENEKKLKKEASKCKKINSFLTKSSWETRGETCGKETLASAHPWKKLGTLLLQVVSPQHLNRLF